MFAIEVRQKFYATHALRLPGGQVEPAHAHEFEVVVSVRARGGGLDEIETVMDFHVLEQAVEVVVGAWRNRDLNEIEPFKTRVNPSAERIAEEVGQRLKSLLTADVLVEEVRLTEAAGCIAIWRGGKE